MLPKGIYRVMNGKFETKKAHTTFAVWALMRTLPH